MIDAHVSTQWLQYKQEVRNILIHVCKTMISILTCLYMSVLLFIKKCPCTKMYVYNVWMVGTMGHQNNGLSEQWFVGMMGRRNNDA